MSSVNKAIIIGRLGKDPEVKTLNSGKQIASFSVATSETWKGKDGEKQEKTEWHNIVVFNENLAKLAERFLTKGSTVYLEGKITTRKWEDKEGATRYTTEIVLDAFNGVMRFIGDAKKKDGGSDEPTERSAGAKAKAPPKQVEYENLDDEVPF